MSARPVRLCLIAAAMVPVMAEEPLPAHAAPVAAPSSMVIDLDGYLGVHSLRKGDWQPIEDQPQAGVLFAIGARGWPIRLAANFLASGRSVTTDQLTPGSEVKYSGSVVEIQPGIRGGIGDDSAFHFELSGGPALIGARQRIDNGVSDRHDRDGTVGIWLALDAYWTLGRHIEVGFHGGLSAATVTLFDKNLRAGGTDLGMLAGVRF